MEKKQTNNDAIQVKMRSTRELSDEDIHKIFVKPETEKTDHIHQ